MLLEGHRSGELEKILLYSIEKTIGLGLSYNASIIIFLPVLYSIGIEVENNTILLRTLPMTRVSFFLSIRL